MAPEIINGNHHYSEKVDVYSYGVILWELFSNEKPFMGLNPIQIAFKIGKGERLQINFSFSPELSTLIQSCWHQEAEKRPSFDQILKMLNIKYFIPKC
jgi:serine/threonine protein kinase